MIPCVADSDATSSGWGPDGGGGGSSTGGLTGMGPEGSGGTMSVCRQAAVSANASIRSSRLVRSCIWTLYEEKQVDKGYTPIEKTRYPTLLANKILFLQSVELVTNDQVITLAKEYVMSRPLNNFVFQQN